MGRTHAAIGMIKYLDDIRTKTYAIGYKKRFALGTSQANDHWKIRREQQRPSLKKYQAEKGDNMIYTYKEIKRTYEKGIRKIQRGIELSAEKKQLVIAAGYAIDLINRARDMFPNNCELNEMVNMKQPGGQVFLSTSVAAYYDMKHETESEVEQCILNLTKLLGSHQLFAHYNVLSNFIEQGMNLQVEFQCVSKNKDEPMAPYFPLDFGPQLKITKEGKIIIFDVYKHMFEALKKDCSFDEELAFGIPSFYNAFKQEVLVQLM